MYVLRRVEPADERQSRFGRFSVSDDTHSDAEELHVIAKLRSNMRPGFKSELSLKTKLLRYKDKV
jgi:hypothetical protein